MENDINRAITERNEIVFSRELIENKRINDKAEQIIIESRRERKRTNITAIEKAIGGGSSLNFTQRQNPNQQKKMMPLLRRWR